MVSPLTQLLQKARDGDPEAARGIFPHVYEELRRAAAVHLKEERLGHTLQATALVHEAFVRLIGIEDPDWKSRAHFFNAASQAMRRILVDHARSRNRLKRGRGAARIALDSDTMVAPADEATDPVDVEALDAALIRLADLNEQQARLVELRYFAGLTEPEAATVLGVSQRKAAKDWAFARAWLKGEMAKHSQ